MEYLVTEYLEPRSTMVLLVVIAVSLAALGRLADMVVDEAVTLSERSGFPKVVIGATIVSLGTTAPEVAVSVMAAIQGNPGLAMGNAVGSIICDTGLILGVACLIRPLHIPSGLVNRQGWVQLGSGMLLILLSIPWAAPFSPWTEGADGVFPRWAGFLFLGLLVVYLYRAATATRSTGVEYPFDDGTDEEGASGLRTPREPVLLATCKLVLASIGIILSANVLIPAVQIVAGRWGVAESIIALTVVAFGTSLPELVTSIQAARRGHGDLAIGNIIGADILNALFVAGASAAVSPGGLTVDQPFFRLSFPVMAGVLIMFRIGVLLCRERLPRSFGVVLVGSYLLYLGLAVSSGLGSVH